MIAGISEEAFRAATLAAVEVPDEPVSNYWQRVGIAAAKAAAPIIRSEERERLAGLLRAKSDELRQIREVSAQLGAGAYEDAADLIEGKE